MHKTHSENKFQTKQIDASLPTRTARIGVCIILSNVLHSAAGISSKKFFQLNRHWTNICSQIGRRGGTWMLHSRCVCIYVHESF